MYCFDNLWNYYQTFYCMVLCSPKKNYIVPSDYKDELTTRKPTLGLE